MIADSRVSVRKRATRAAWITLVCCWLCAAPGLVAAATPVDLVLALEDSRATAAADPDRRLAGVLGSLLADLPSGSRVALIAYDDLATPLVPLTALADGGVAKVTEALQGLRFAARLTNGAAGLERAIYELAQTPDTAARRVVLFQQSAPIGVGDPDKDLAFRRWALEVLSGKASAAGIELAVISVGGDADLALGSALAEHTGGVALEAATSDRLPQVVAALQPRLGGVVRAAASPQLLPPPPDIAQAEIARTEIAPAEIALPDTEPAASAPATPDVPDEPVARAAPEPPPTPRLARVDELDRLPEPAAGPAGTFAAADRAVDRPAFRLPPLPPFAPDHPVWLGAGVALLLCLTLVGLWVVRRRGRRTETQVTGQLASATGARLVDVSGVSGRDTYPLSGKLARVSRAPGPDTDNVVTVHIPHDVISRSHAFIELRRGAYWVTDPGSNNGTFVNDERVDGSRRLKHGDRIRFATFEFRFEHPEHQDAAAADDRYAPIGTPPGDRTVALGSGAAAVDAATQVFGAGSPEDRTTLAPQQAKPSPGSKATPGAAGGGAADAEQDPTIVRPAG